MSYGDGQRFGSFPFTMNPDRILLARMAKLADAADLKWVLAECKQSPRSATHRQTPVFMQTPDGSRCRALPFSAARRQLNWH